MTTVSTALYRAAARLLARTVLRSEMVTSVYVRRSVAAGEAAFPFSDVDMAMVVSRSGGRALGRLQSRYALARMLFPRLGECLVFRQEDLAEFAVTDPYRASLDRRVVTAAAGPPPQIPAGEIPSMEAARRLVFWFDPFIPRALQDGNQRNLRKFALEMANALGVLEGRWKEPLPSRAETLRRFGPPDGDAFEFCCRMAARAHSILLPPAPRLREPLTLRGIHLLPEPARARAAAGIRVMTPEVLDLLLQTQNPALWWEHGEELRKAGFSAPSPSAWTAYARRCLGGHRLRGPGFSERGTQALRGRLRNAGRILQSAPPAARDERISVAAYYAEFYDAFADWAAAQRLRIQTGRLRDAG